MLAPGQMLCVMLKLSLWKAIVLERMLAVPLGPGQQLLLDLRKQMDWLTLPIDVVHAGKLLIPLG